MTVKQVVSSFGKSRKLKGVTDDKVQVIVKIDDEYFYVKAMNVERIGGKKYATLKTAISLDSK